MPPISRRDLLGLLALAGLYPQAKPRRPAVDVHRQLLDLAARQEEQRRERFRAVKSTAELEALQRSLREAFLGLHDGLPTASGPPPMRTTGRLKGDGYVVEKLVFESFPGYFVSALLYRPEPGGAAAPGVLGPCGHSTVGKAHDSYQTLHINLAKRGFVVLTYDPVGQGERSQYWDVKRGRSRFDLSCGEHCVLGNPLYLLGTNLARYRIWDAIRALDLLAALPGVDPSRLGCVGNSGGGTLTSYLAAIDSRVRVPVIGCYITTLPRRMANRVQEDPSADPEQDPAGFVSRGIDHAGLLALMVPRPTLICAAQLDFFPIEGTRESHAEAKKLYRVAGAEERIGLVEAPQKHGLSQPLREATYAWFDRWLSARDGGRPAKEVAVTPRPAKDLLVCPDGQVSVSFRSRPLLPLALEDFRSRGKRPRVPLKDLLRSNLDGVDFRLTEIAAGTREDAPLILCINGNEAPDWAREQALLDALAKRGNAVKTLDPRGVGRLRVALPSRGSDYADPLSGVEENLAYNAFLVGESLLGMRVADVLAAVAELSEAPGRRPIVLCGRRDSALVACLAAALEPRIARVAIEGALLTFLPLFAADGPAINAASMLPGMLRDYGDIPDVLAEISPRQVFAAAPRGTLGRPLPSVQVTDARFTAEPKRLLDWLAG
jgi:dienelactone hydrolase/pimeloyl-ACP methyl ester carboxylesterase